MNKKMTTFKKTNEHSENRNNKIEVLPPVRDIQAEASFESFVLGYKDENYTSEELRIIYLRGYLGLNYEDVGKALKISKQKARIEGKELEKEICNVRTERQAEVRRLRGATSANVQNAKALLLGKAIEELEKKLKNSAVDLESMSVDRLINLITKLGDELPSESILYTGRKDALMDSDDVEEELREEF